MHVTQEDSEIAKVTQKDSEGNMSIKKLWHGSRYSCVDPSNKTLQNQKRLKESLVRASGTPAVRRVAHRLRFLMHSFSQEHGEKASEESHCSMVRWKGGIRGADSAGGLDDSHGLKQYVGHS